MDITEKIAELVGEKKASLLSKMRDVLVDEGKKIAVDFDIAFKTYLKNAYEKYSKVKTLLYKNEPRDLYDFFVCNDVKLHDRTISCSSTDGILDISNFNIIVGSGGTGKSIMMRHFFMSELAKKDLIPLFWELRTYTGGSIDSCLYQSLNNLGFSWEKKYFQYALKTGCFLVLLDGYDEIPEIKKMEFYQELDQFCDRYPQNWYIISTRQNGSFVGWQRFTEFHIKPLSKNQAKELIQKLEYDHELKERFIQNFDDLYVKHRSFASNPLLLNIMLITYDNFADIPEKRHVFYSNAFDTLYAVHDATKGGFKRYQKSGLSSDIFKKIFAEFCFISYLKGKIEFTYDDLAEILECGKRQKADFNIEAYICDLMDAVCLIYKEGNTYLFTHRSFQEYFTALYLRNLDDNQQQQACNHLLDIRNPSLDSDSVFEMLMDMNQERFDSNFIIPMLQDMEASLPSVYEDELLRRFVGYVNALEIYTQENVLKDSSKFNWNYYYLIRSQKSIYFCATEFKNQRYPRILSFICTHYKKQQLVSKSLRGLTPYLETPYLTENVWRDRAFYEKIMQTTLGQLLRGSIGLLSELENQRKNNQDEFQKLLESYRVELTDNEGV